MSFAFDDHSIELAKRSLEAKLKRILGQDLPGVTGYGARWDKDMGSITLGVLVDDRQDTEVLRRALPPTINNMPVKVSRRPAARAQSSASFSTGTSKSRVRDSA